MTSPRDARSRLTTHHQVTVAAILLITVGAGWGPVLSFANDIGHDRGNPDAPIVVIEFLDFGCRYCAVFALESFPAIDAEFIATGRVRWRTIPFVVGAFRGSRDAAHTAECAGEQGAFWQMHDHLFRHRKAWSASREPWRLFHRYADELALNPRHFAACAADDEIRQRIERHDRLARRAHVRATPTFFVNGRRVEGALPLPLFQRILIDAVPRRTP